MSTVEIKQELLKFIEQSDDNSILKFYEMLKSKDNMVTYTTNEKTLTKEQYKKHLNAISNSVKNGAKTNTTKEVKEFTLNSCHQL